MKDSFILHHDTLSVINELTDEQSGQLIKEIYSYSNYINNPIEANKPTGLNGLMNSVLHPFKMQLDRDFGKYLNIVERNTKNGQKGGRPQKTKNPIKPKKADSDNVSVKEKDSVSDKDKGSDIIIEDTNLLLAKNTITYLNRQTGKSFRDGAGNLKEILAQIKKGATEQQLAHVINVKCSEWLNDTKNKKHLNPVTLFRESNFDRYLNQDFVMNEDQKLEAYFEARDKGLLNEQR